MNIPPIPSAARHEQARQGHSPSPSAETPVMRKFRIASLTRKGAIYSTDQVGPASSAFEAAFSGFAHGTLIKTADGMVAVEDLLPGTDLITAEQGPMPLSWIGSMTLVPAHQAPATSNPRLTRVMADSLGPARPSTDLMAGPGARILTRRVDLPGQVGSDQVLTPVRKLVDGVNIIEISPPRPVSIYHLCLHRHATITVAGLQAETFHPGPGFERHMRPSTLQLFLSFFPHIHAPSDFGPLAHPRISENSSGNPG